ncbi:MAG: hypothetical protein UT37_C0015G0011 [Parcubacteria group bacterium GW2011_GWA2_39_18]|nr:MAG: hypothetical protein UT37_C0015G0011 [Parcubacteria group bacterium GW2011_GWA2_39_18]
MNIANQKLTLNRLCQLISGILELFFRTRAYSTLLRTVQPAIEKQNTKDTASSNNATFSPFQFLKA